MFNVPENNEKEDNWEWLKNQNLQLDLELEALQLELRPGRRDQDASIWDFARQTNYQSGTHKARLFKKIILA